MGKTPKVAVGVGGSAVQNEDAALWAQDLLRQDLGGGGLKAAVHGLRNRPLRETYQPKIRSPGPPGTPGSGLPGPVQGPSGPCCPPSLTSSRTSSNPVHGTAPGPAPSGGTQVSALCRSPLGNPAAPHAPT